MKGLTAMSKKHFYRKFPEEVSEELEKTYNKIVRHEEYLYEKDAVSKAIFFGDEEELYSQNISRYIINQETEEKEHAKKCGKIAVLHKALERLKKDYPMEYEIIQLYYFSEKKITQREIGIKRHITKQAVNKLLKNAYKHLKQYIIINKNND